MSIFRQSNGMNIVGQGGKILLFMFPALIAAILVHAMAPAVAALPQAVSFLRVVGVVLLIPGLILWAAAVSQLLLGFPKGKLVTSGAYGVVRNPIYCSVALFILPAISFLTMTWVYLVPAAFLAVGVILFIGKEEAKLTQVFGDEYIRYCERVDRLIPFRKPGAVRGR